MPAMASAEEQGGDKAAELAAERVREIVAAAEQAAAAIVADAETEARRIREAAEGEADEIRAAARAESDEKVEAASREASGRIEQARGAVEGLVAQADRLRAQVGALGRDLAANVPGTSGREAAEASDAPEPVSPEAGHAGAGPESGTGGNGEEAEDDASAAAAAVPAGADPLAPRDDPAAADDVAGPGRAPTADQGAVRLVAMNMALEGASRDEIAKQVEADFGPIAGVDAMLDDVLSRAGR
jgi:hypothetical protein